MSELYWITRLDNLVAMFMILAILFGIAAIVCLIIWLCELGFDEEYSTLSKTTRKLCITSTIICLISIFSAVFIPSTKEFCFMYVGSNIIDYVENNEKLKEMPDKVIDLADEYLDKMLNDENSEQIETNN